jgi:ABC-type phosphate/phosphonate transport system permease subunit
MLWKMRYVNRFFTSTFIGFYIILCFCFSYLVTSKTKIKWSLVDFISNFIEKQIKFKTHWWHFNWAVTPVPQTQFHSLLCFVIVSIYVQCTLSISVSLALPFWHNKNIYSNPSVYKQSVYEFSLIRDAQIYTCFSIYEPIFTCMSSFLLQTDHCSQCLFSGNNGKLIFVLQVFALRAVWEERIKLLNRGIPVLH